MEVTYHDADLPTTADLIDLYDSVGWSAYTCEPDRLHAAVARSLRVVTARVEEQLVGLARVVGDGLTIVYMQDILVRPEHQRAGIGRELFTRALKGFEDVRQKVLITDDEPELRAFYEAMGFNEVGSPEYPGLTFVQFS